MNKGHKGGGGIGGIHVMMVEVVLMAMGVWPMGARIRGRLDVVLLLELVPKLVGLLHAVVLIHELLVLLLLEVEDVLHEHLDLHRFDLCVEELGTQLLLLLFMVRHVDHAVRSRARARSGGGPLVLARIVVSIGREEHGLATPVQHSD